MSEQSNFEDLSNLSDAVEPAPQEPEAQDVSEPQEAAPNPAQDQAAEDAQPHTVPVSAVKAERERRQMAEMQLKMLQDQMAQHQPTGSGKAPDPIENPEAYTAYMQDIVQKSALNTRLDISEEMARQAHGDEKVDAALEALRAAGLPADQFLNTRHPWGELVKWHEAQAAMQEIGDPVKYRERLKLEIMAEIAAQSAAPAAPSLARETSIGSRSTAGSTGFTPLSSLLPD